MSENMEAGETSVAAWRMAIKNRPIHELLLSHSGKGVQYAYQELREQMEGMPVLQSMSREGELLG